MNVVAAARDTRSWAAMSLGRAPSGPPRSTATSAAWARCDSPYARNARSPARSAAALAATMASVSWRASSERSVMSVPLHVARYTLHVARQMQPRVRPTTVVNILTVNMLTMSGSARDPGFPWNGHRGTWNVERLTSFGPIHRRGRATADALQAGGLAREVLPIVTQGTNGIGGDDRTALPSYQGGPQHPGARHNTPEGGGLAPNRPVGAGR